jgi:DNA polymerase III delta prime subunit
MKWFDLVTPEPVREGSLFEKYGPHVRIKVVGKVGRLVRHFNKHGHFPSRAYLFAGDPGIGKTALVKLMAMTHIAQSHEPITYQFDDQERIILIDDDTEEPLVVNPLEADGRTFEMVHRAVENTGDSGNQLIESYNASRLNKPDIDEITATFDAPSTLYGSRVIYFNEFDNVGSKQVPALKSSLNPGGNIPEDLLVLADTNHIDAVEQSLGDGGMERFTDIQFGRWSYDSLASATDRYLTAFGIEVNPEDFEPKKPKHGGQATVFEAAVDLIVRESEGSIRNVLQTISHLAELGRPMVKEDVIETQSSYEGDDDDSSQLFSRFFNVVYDSQTPHGFAANAASRGNSFTKFSAQVSHYMLNQDGLLNNSDVHQGVIEMSEIASGDAPRPVKWAAAVPALTDFARAIRNN